MHRSDSLLFPEAVRKLVAGRTSAAAGGPQLGSLTDRESEVLRLIARWLSNAEIAAELFLGVETVKSHARNVLAKLCVRDRVQAVIAAYDSGFVTGR